MSLGAEHLTSLSNQIQLHARGSPAACSTPKDMAVLSSPSPPPLPCSHLSEPPFMAGCTINSTIIDADPAQLPQDLLQEPPSREGRPLQRCGGGTTVTQTVSLISGHIYRRLCMTSRRGPTPRAGPGRRLRGPSGLL